MKSIALPRASFSQLRAFEAVARLGGVTLAARSLHLAQPTVSVQLRELAALVGADLLAPAGRGVVLTPAGTALLSTIRAIGTHWQLFVDEVEQLQALQKGVLRIAGVTTAEYFIARVLKPFHLLYPGITINLTIDNRDAVVRRMQSEEDDIGVMMVPPTDVPLDSYAFLDNPLVLIVHRGHRWDGAHRISLKSLDQLPLLMREPGSGTRQTTLAWLAQRGIAPLVQMTLGSNEAIKHAVAAELGIAIVSRHTLPADPAGEGLAIVNVAGMPIPQKWKLVWRSDRQLTLAAGAFLTFVRQRPEPADSAGG